MNLTVRAQSPEFPKARSVPREGNAVPHGRSGRAEGGSVCSGMRLWAASRQGRRRRRGRFRPASRVPGPRRPPAACMQQGAGRERAPRGAETGPGSVPDKVPQTRVPRPTRPQPKRPPPPPQARADPARRQRQVPAVEPAAPAPPPAQPLPALRDGRGETERAGGWRRTAPLTMVGGAATPAGGDALSRVASVPLPRARPRPLYLPPPTPTPSARAPPACASPPPRARATPAWRSDPQGRFERPPLSAPSPNPGLAGRVARRAAGEGRGRRSGGPVRPRAPPPGSPASPALPRRPLPGGP